MLEKQIELKLIEAVKNKGGIALKLSCPSFAGMPDRLILLPHRKIGFVELKAPGQKLRPLQARRKRQLEQLGFLVYTVDNTGQIQEVLNEIGGDAK